MIDQSALQKKYNALLKLFFQHEEEKALYEVSELGKELVLAKLGPDVLLDIHSFCIKETVKDMDPLMVSRLVVNANELLLNGIMAYAMNYYNFMDLLDAEKRKLEIARSDITSERNKLDDIVSAIDADLLLLDRDMKIHWINKKLKERNPYTRGDMVGQLCNKAYCNIEHVPEDCPAATAFESEKPVRQEHPITHPDGTTRFYLFTCSPIRDGGGNVTHVLELVQDITDKKKIEDEVKQKAAELEQANIKLREIDQLKSMFIASMSHELRTPLNSVIGFSSIMLKEWHGTISEEQQKDLSIILRAGKHLLALINDVIDVSKIEAGMIEVNVEGVDVFDVIAEAIDLLKKDIKDKELELQVEAIHQTIQTDRRRLLQCVTNLMSNAMKFTEKGRVQVTAQRIQNAESRIQNGGYVEISVADTGIGIKQEDMSKLFNPFVRLDSHLRSTVFGTGLGLYLTKKLVVEALRGEISVTSRHGEGSAFVLRIPINRSGGAA